MYSRLPLQFYYLLTVRWTQRVSAIALFGAWVLSAAPPLRIGPASLPNGTAGTPYNQTFTVTGGSPPYIWSVSNGSLPAGLSLSQGGAITGTPTAAGTSQFTIQVNAGTDSATKDYSITIADPPLNITSGPLPNGTVGTAYNQALSASGGSGGYTWSLMTGSLPAGLTLSATGTISGTPTTAGSSNFTVRVTDSSQGTANKPLSIMVAAPPPLTITTTSLPNGTFGTAYSQALTATGGTGGYTWSVTSGSLPAGLSLSAGGTIAGTPSAAGTANFTVQVKDSSQTTANKPLSITVSAPPLTITTASLPSGTVGTAYSQALAASGGTAGYTWSVTSGSLPAGLSLSAGGTIAGTPSAAGTANFTVQVKDSSQTTSSKPLSITVSAPPLTITTGSLPSATVGTAYSQSLAASGGTGGYAWSVTSGSLPAGLSLSAGGTIAGTPSAAGTANFTVQVKDSSQTTANKPLSITVSAPPLTITTGSLPSGMVGTAYSQTLAATGGTGGYAWSVASGSLPAGLSLSATGAISGTPTSAGSSTFTIQVKDSSNTTATQPLTITIAPAALTITTTSLPNGTVGTAYSQTLAASGGTGGYAWSVTSGSLPAGLSLSAGGTIAGTPSAAGPANFTIQVKDSSNTTATQPLTITIAPARLTITTTSLAGGTVGTTYSQTLAATGGTGGYAWSVASGSLPAGLSLSAGGTIAGTPSAAGPANFTIQVKDSSNATATQSLTITIAPAGLTITTTSLPNGTVGTAYTQTLAATGGTGGYAWSVTSGSLPAGLSLSAGGTIAGTPSAAGPANFTIQVKDSSNTTATQSLTITIAPATLTITTTSLPNGTVGTAYTQTLAATGGTGGYAWSVASGSLPAGLSLSAGGTIAGTPSAAGSSNFTIQVKDSSNTTATQSLTITIAPATLTITTTSLPNGTVGTAYNQTLAASGGSGAYAWTISSGALPGGLSMSAAGAISGTPTSAGAANFMVQLKDATGAATTQSFTLTISPASLGITTVSLPSASLGTPYSQSLSASGGSGNYSWSITAGGLPQGLSLSQAGVISGAPNVATTSTFTVSVTDGSSTANRNFTVTVIAPPVITSTSLPNGVVGAPYSATLTGSGGAAPYTWSIVSGQLPPGLTLDPNSGVISGSPKLAGAFTVRVDLTDANSTKAEANLAITISAALSITTASVLATGSAGAPYTQSFAATGGAPPYVWTLSGALPAGLTFSAGGSLGGTPTQVGTFPIAVGVADSAGSKASASYSLVVVSGLAIATAPMLPSASSGVPYSVTLQPAGGAAPYSWVVTAGALPGGINFGSDGLISGTPLSTGNFSFTAQVTDGASHTAQKSFTLAVAGALSITATTLPSGATGSPYSQTFTAAGGTPPYSWTVTAGALPTGLTLEIPTGVLSGMPTQPQTYTFTVTVTDANSVTTSRQFAVTIGAGLTFLTAASLPNATAGASYTSQLQAAGGTPPYSWSVVQGSLPAGLSLNGATGTISGSPTAAGAFNFTVEVTDTANLTATRAFTVLAGLPAVPAISMSGISGNVQPLQQPAIAISLASPYPVAITGTAALTFQPSGPNAVDDPSVQFASGGRSATFTIPANATQATLSGSQFVVQAGTVAGTISITVVSLQAAGQSLDVPAGLTLTATIAAGPPIIQTITLVHTASGIQLQIVGVTDTRELTQASVTFQSAAGATVQDPQLTVPLASVATGWFQSSTSASFGGQFALTLPFTFQGNVSLSSVSVTLSNTSGDSQPASANY